MRISDWSSDVCSSDLRDHGDAVGVDGPDVVAGVDHAQADATGNRRGDAAVFAIQPRADRKAYVKGKKGTGRVDLGSPWISKTKNIRYTQLHVHTVQDKYTTFTS